MIGVKRSDILNYLEYSNYKNTVTTQEEKRNGLNIVVKVSSLSQKPFPLFNKKLHVEYVYFMKEYKTSYFVKTGSTNISNNDIIK